MDKSDFIEWTKKLQDSYYPSEYTKEKLSQIDLVAIVGPTGVGKSAIIEKLGIHYVLSDVSRDPRPGEKSGKSYFFRTDYLDMIKEIKNGQYVQFLVSKNDEFYGSKLSSYPENGGCTMAIQAEALHKFRKLGFRSVTPIYIMPPSYVEWMRRIGGVRSDDLLARIGESRKSILTATEDSSYHFVLNDDIDKALKDIWCILKGEEVDQRRAQLAFDTADILLEHIGEGSLDI